MSGDDSSDTPAPAPRPGNAGDSRLLGAAGLLAASVLLARVLGYLRDALFAWQVGVGGAADAYFAAFLIPDLLGYLLAAGAAAVAVTPPYLRRLERDGEVVAARFASVVVGSVGFVALLSTAVLMAAAEPLVGLQFPEFDAATRAETVRLMRIVLPAQVFFLTGGVLRGVLMAHGVFWPQALASVVYSAAPIVGGLVTGSAVGFAWGTLAGAALGQWAIPVLALRRRPGAVSRVRVGLFDGDFKEYVWLALPLMLGFGLTTVDEWIEKILGGLLGDGAIATLTYARKLMMVPVGVVGQAVGAALLPSLAALHERDDRDGFGALLGRSLTATLALGLVAAGALTLLAEPLVVFLYQRGAFTADDTAHVTRLLRVLAWAVPGWVVQQVGVRGFYARGEMWQAMGLSTVVAVAMVPLYVFGMREGGLLGLATASSLAISLNALITLVWLRLRTGVPDLVPLARTLATTGAFVAGLGFALARTPAALSEWLGAGAVWAGVTLGAVGGAYLGLLGLLGWHFGDPGLRDGLRRSFAALARRHAGVAAKRPPSGSGPLA